MTILSPCAKAFPELPTAFLPLAPCQLLPQTSTLSNNPMTLAFFCQLRHLVCQLLPQNAGPTVLLNLISLNLILQYSKLPTHYPMVQNIK